MADLLDVVRYLCVNYPYKDELSKARVVKMIYLADWRSAIVYGRTITDITWVFNHYGPYVERPISEARSAPGFHINESRTMYGNLKETVSFQGEPIWPSLSDREIEVLDHVIETTKSKTWSSFLNLVYSTYPVSTQERYSELDLVTLASQYRDVRSDFDWGVPRRIEP